MECLLHTTHGSGTVLDTVIHSCLYRVSKVGITKQGERGPETHQRSPDWDLRQRHLVVLIHSHLRLLCLCAVGGHVPSVMPVSPTVLRAAAWTLTVGGK